MTVVNVIYMKNRLHPVPVDLNINVNPQAQGVCKWLNGIKANVPSLWLMQCCSRHFQLLKNGSCENMKTK